jgi:hypothetical protein
MPEDAPKRLAGSSGAATAVVANVLTLAAAAAAAAFLARNPDLYYQSVQEDEWLEWASVWAFLGATALALRCAVRQRRSRSGFPWFLLGLSAFCFAVAMEEISWGQRILGYRPPTYFLEHNYQQELNVHNVVAKDLRTLALKAVIVGYGVVLPVLVRIPGLGARLRRFGVLAPPAALVPAFLGTYLLYGRYPWKFTGEGDELMLGLGFLLGLLLDRLESGRTPAPRRRGVVGLVTAAALVLAAGALSAAWSRERRDAHPENLEAARMEMEALRRDFVDARIPSGCGLHKRLYTFVEASDAEALRRGSHAALRRQGLPEERLEFLLDPWNSPYWIRDACSDDRQRRRIMIYSLGPNRMRDSNAWETGGDDIGTVVFEARPES